jgi:hypothetical protein
MGWQFHARSRRDHARGVDPWVSARVGGAIWGDYDESSDPITQITDTAFTLRWHKGEDRAEVTESAPERRFVPDELWGAGESFGSFRDRRGAGSV